MAQRTRSGTFAPGLHPASRSTRNAESRAIDSACAAAARRRCPPRSSSRRTRPPWTVPSSGPPVSGSPPLLPLVVRQWLAALEQPPEEVAFGSVGRQPGEEIELFVAGHERLIQGAVSTREQTVAIDLGLESTQVLVSQNARLLGQSG